MSKKTILLATFYGGLKLRIESALKDKLPAKFLLISNHQSLADIPILVCSFLDHDLKFTAKKELKYGIPSVSMGLSSRNGRLLSESTFLKETETALKKAAEEGKNSIIAFESNPDKYRKILSKKL